MAHEKNTFRRREMKKIEYFCNLCRDEIKQDLFGNGVHFIAYPISIMFKRLNECETHICNKCAKSIHSILAKEDDEMKTQA